MKKVLIAGDSILDEYIYGSVERISPEAPVPILDFEKYEYRLGGASNVAHNIKTISKEGAQIDYFGYCNGFITDTLYRMDIRPILPFPIRVIQKTRYIADNRHLLRLDNKKRYEEELDYSKLNFDDYDLVVVSDYGKGSLGERFFQEVFWYKQYNRKTNFLIETKRHFNRSYNAIYKCNQKESLMISPYDTELLLQNSNAFVITKGANGFEVCKSCVHYKDDLYLEHPAVSKESEIVDVCGAGDTFLAGMAVNYLETGNWDAFEMAKFGNECAGEKVKLFGTTAVKREWIERQ